MDLDNIDWSTVVLRGASVLGVWLIVWAVWYFVVRWIKGLDRIKSLPMGERDVHVLTQVATMVLSIIGLGATLSVLQLTPLLFTSSVLWRIVALAMTWVIVWILVRYLSHWIEALDEKVDGIDIDPRDLRTLDRLLDYVIILVGVIASLAILNITSLLYSALTAAGIVSVMIGFAVQDIAANFISGIFLLIDRPFVVGDVIQIKSYSGTVNKISLRSTEIITFDGPVVTIPNNTLAVEPTTNFTLSQDRRILFIVSVLPSSDLNQVIKTIQDVLEAEGRLIKDRAPSITVGEIRDYAVDLQVAAYTDKDDLYATQSDLQKEIVTAFASQGIELAVPLRMNVNPVLAAPNTLTAEETKG
jgi:small conductance mechanosensitive channel